MKALEEIKVILAKVLECDEAEIDIDTNTKLFAEDSENNLGLSSIDYVEFMVEIEERFNIVYDFDTKISSVGELLEYIETYTN